MGKVCNMNCSVSGCNSRRAPDVHFHRFPRSNSEKVSIVNHLGNVEKIDRRRAWEIKLKRVTPAGSGMSVCSRHFIKEDYFPQGVCNVRPKLKRTAVPSVNLPQASIDTRKTHAKRERVNDTSTNTTATFKNLEVDANCCRTSPYSFPDGLHDVPKNVQVSVFSKNKNSKDLIQNGVAAKSKEIHQNRSYYNKKVFKRRKLKLPTECDDSNEDNFINCDIKVENKDDEQNFITACDVEVQINEGEEEFKSKCEVENKNNLIRNKTFENIHNDEEELSNIFLVHDNKS